MLFESVKKISKEKVQRYLFVGLAVIMFLLPMPQLFMPDEDYSVYVQATILWIALLYFGIVILIEVLSGRAGIKNSGLALKCVATLAAIGVISLWFSDDKMISICGAEIRFEGLLAILSYYAIFYAAVLLKNREYRKKLFYCFIILGSIVAVMGILQLTGLYGFGDKYVGIAYAPMRNPNFFGGFTVLFAGVAIGGFYMYSRESDLLHPVRWWNRFTWYGVVLLSYAACISAGSSLVYAGLIMMLLLYLFFVIVAKREKFLSFIALVVGLLGMIILLDNICNGVVLNEVNSLGNQIKAEGSVFGDRVGSGRMEIWKLSLSLIPKYGLFGCGIERLGKHGLELCEGWSWYFDKAHNEYLNLWLTEGIFALVTYLVFLFSLFIPGIMMFIKKKTSEKEEKNELAMVALFAFFGYIAQAFFNISVIQVAPYFWMICGFLYNKQNKQKVMID